MKVLKGILLVIGILVTLILVVAVFLPGTAVVTRTVEVNKPVETTFNYVADYTNYIKWNAWSKMDPDALSELTGTPGEIGQIYSWDGDVVGKGTLTLKELEPYTSINGELIFISPMQGSAVDDWKFESLENGTRIIWTFATELGYPIGRFFGLMMDGQLGPQLDEGLSNLKAEIEAIPEAEIPEEMAESLVE